MSYQSTRTIFYVIILILSLLHVLLSFFTIADYTSNKQVVIYVYNIPTGLISLGQFIFICVLLGFNNRPNSTHRLATSRSHFISAIVFSFLWLGCGILMSIISWVATSDKSVFSSETRSVRIVILIFQTIFEFMMYIISVTLIVLIYEKSKANVYGLQGNIAYKPKEDMA
ncbi:hypothetical protein C8Q75DRAFT_503721 [Abortiporus biennis]|nr:hypothetical protein C8Q75DRAFT_503721 [Abortiporus biennis]